LLSLNDRFNRLFLKEFFEILRSDKSSRFLDLGCGARPYQILYKDIFANVTCADIEIRASGIDVIANIENLPFKERSFDVVLLSEVIEHVPDEKAALNEIHRILVPGGMAIITFPFMHQMHELPNDFRRNTEFGMQRALKESGFDVELLRRRGDIFSLALSLSGDIFHGFVSVLCRLPFVGVVFKPFLWVAEWLLGLLYKAMAILQYRAKHLNPQAVGIGLSGYRGHCALFTLGYCVLVRKMDRK